MTLTLDLRHDTFDMRHTNTPYHETASVAKRLRFFVAQQHRCAVDYADYADFFNEHRWHESTRIFFVRTIMTNNCPIIRFNKSRTLGGIARDESQCRDSSMVVTLKVYFQDNHLATIPSPQSIDYGIPSASVHNISVVSVISVWLNNFWIIRGNFCPLHTPSIAFLRFLRFLRDI